MIRKKDKGRRCCCSFLFGLWKRYCDVRVHNLFVADIVEEGGSLICLLSIVQNCCRAKAVTSSCGVKM